MFNLEKNKYLTKFFNRALIFLLICWIGIAFVRTSINTIKIFTEERQWLYLDEDKKRDIIYGDIYGIFRKVNTLANINSNIFLLSQDGKAFFVLRYLLYQKKIYWVKNIKEVYRSSNNDYVIVYHHADLRNKNNFLYIDSFNTKNSESYLYKIQ